MSMRMIGSVPLAFFLVFAMQARAADNGTGSTTSTDPKIAAINAETDRLKAEKDLYTAQADLIKAKYGTPAQAPTGTITNPEKFSALGQWTLAAATDHLATDIVAAWKAVNPTCPAGGILISSTLDRRSRYEAAVLISDRLDAFAKALDEVVNPPQPPPPPHNGQGGAHAGGARASIASAGAIVQGVVGTLDSLVALFRTDYTFNELTGVSADDLSLRMSIANKLRSIAPCNADGSIVNVEGLEGPRRGSPDLLIDKYKTFIGKKAEATGQLAGATALASTDAAKARNAQVKALLDAANEFDTALTTPKDGQTPLINAAIALTSSGMNQSVIYAKFGPYGSSIVTRKKLLSKNDAVTAVAGGQGQLAIFNEAGQLVHIGVFRLDQRVGGNLSDILNSTTVASWKSPITLPEPAAASK